MAQQIKKKFLSPEIIDFFEDQIDSVQTNLNNEEQSRIDGDTELSSRVSPLEDIASFQKNVLFENNAAVVADGQPGVEDSTDRKGWYYQNQVTGQKINWYFFDGSSQASIQKQNFSAYAVVTLDSIISLPIMAVYTIPTGTNDVIPGFAHSRYIYSVYPVAPVAGKKYLLYIGEAPSIHPELPRLQVNLSNSQGDQSPTENVFTVSFGTNSGASAGNVKLIAEHIGVSSPEFKNNYELEIKAASLTKLAVEEAARIAGDAGVQSSIDDLSAIVQGNFDLQQTDIDGIRSDVDFLTSETQRLDIAVNDVNVSLQDEIVNRQLDLQSEESARISGDANLQSQIDSFSGTFATSTELSSAVSTLEAADSILDGKIETEKGRIDAILMASDADKDSFAEIVALINSVDTENDQAFASYVTSNNAAMELKASIQYVDDSIAAIPGVDLSPVEGRLDVLEAKGFAKGSQVVGTELSYIDLDRVYSVLLSVSVGRLAIHEGEDYSTSVVGGVTRVTWMGSLLSPDGVEAIEEGDKVFWSGSY